MNPVHWYIGWKRNRELRQRSRAYEQPVERAIQLNWQLRSLNACWKRICNNVPHYSYLLRSNRVPRTLRSIEEFVSSVPVTTRSTVQSHLAEMSDRTRKPDFWRMTGGTTSEPIQIPAWNSEYNYTSPDIWVARSWYGVTPWSRLFLVWGHSHLLGTGVKGWLNGLIRSMKDQFLEYYRFNAYDISEKAMRRAGSELLRFKPHYVIGYSVALDSFARTNQHLREEFGKLNLKVSIGAAEGFPSHDSKDIIEETLSCPVSMEYGSVETALIAHLHPEGYYIVPWRTYFVEAGEKGHSEGRAVRITSLYPRCFPLIRYEIGDEIELFNEENYHHGITMFKRVIGRCNDYVKMPDGTMIHSETVTHSVRWCKSIRGYQLVSEGGELYLNLVSEYMTKDEEKEVRRKLLRIHPGFKRLKMNHVAELEKTIAGKTHMIINR